MGMAEGVTIERFIGASGKPVAIFTMPDGQKVFRRCGEAEDLSETATELLAEHTERQANAARRA